MVVAIVSNSKMNGTGFSKVSIFLHSMLREIGYEVVHLALNCVDVSKSAWGAAFDDDIVRHAEQCDEVYLSSDVMKDAGDIDMYLDALKPEIVFLVTDPIICCQLLNRIQTGRRSYKIVSYITVEYLYPTLKYNTHISSKSDVVLIPSDRMMRNLRDDMRIAGCFEWVPFSVCKDVVTKTYDLRSSVRNDDSTFVIVNPNRNSFRKSQDVTIKAYAHFIKTGIDKALFSETGDWDVELFVRNQPRACGYDLHDIVDVEAIRFFGADEDKMRRFKQSIKVIDWHEHDIENLYARASVVVNTCCGEGFGMCAYEAWCAGVPVVYSDVAGLRDFTAHVGGNDALAIGVKPCHSVRVAADVDSVGGDLEHVDACDVADAIWKIYTATQPGASLSRAEAIGRVDTLNNTSKQRLDTVLNKIGNSPNKTLKWSHLNLEQHFKSSSPTQIVDVFLDYYTLQSPDVFIFVKETSAVRLAPALVAAACCTGRVLASSDRTCLVVPRASARDFMKRNMDGTLLYVKQNLHQTVDDQIRDDHLFKQIKSFYYRSSSE